ncbi:MAG TPA: FAD-binding oxidoreductase [Pseudorhizobium sp.]|nr:FAD-binding oxidoreductase [Pseudorhizobium sp.]
MHGWGRYPRIESKAIDVRFPNQVADQVRSGSGLIGRGNGRSYGDAAIGNPNTMICRSLSRMKSFDPSTGSLTVEAGTMLSEILDAFLPRGWFPPVVPGTKLVTVGGMIASDVHGKNHHRDGGFGAHVEEMKLVLANGETVTCSARDNEDLFYATIGGMGLTGIIVEASFRMKPIETGWVLQKTVVAEDLAAAIDALDATSDSTYSVAWIDCLSRGKALGRSLIFAGEHATADQLASLGAGQVAFPAPQPARLRLPVDLPGWTLNRASVAAFNELYFRAGARKASKPRLVHWNPYFFPLDGINDWNRLYGRRGFVQHQCVVPEARAVPVLTEILERFTRSGRGSFLAVLKKLGSGTGLLSFPMPGYTLALDLPAAPDVFALLDEIDQLVVEAGGRLYLAKDARQSRQTFEAGYPDLEAFKALRRRIDPERHFNSQLATRLGL